MALDPEFQALLSSSNPAQAANPAPAAAAAPSADGLDPEFAALVAPAQSAQKSAPPAKAKPRYALGAPVPWLSVPSFKDAMVGMPENALHMGTGLASSVVGGLAAAGDWPLYGLGVTNKRPDDLLRDIQNKFTYEPRTEGGQAAAFATSLPGQAVANASNTVGKNVTGAVLDATGMPKVAGTVGGLADSALQSLPMFVGSKLPYVKPNTVNIGLNVGGKTALTQADALAALRKQGANVKSAVVQQSGTEPTVVARTRWPLSPDQANAVSQDLGQDSIAQAGPEGNALFGPQASKWGPFNKGYFLKDTGESMGPVVPGQDPILSDAANMGIRLTPDQAQTGVTAGRIAQSLSGSAKLERSLSRKNAPQINAAINAQVGVPEGVEASKEALEAAKAQPNAVYARAGATGTVGLPTEITEQGSVSALHPTLVRAINTARAQMQLPPSDLTSMDANELINTSRQLRAMGFANKNAARYNPALKVQGDTQLAASKALEDSLDQHIQQVAKDPRSGVPTDLFPQLVAARQKLAQIASARRALRPGGNYFAGSFAKQLDQGVPLTGAQKTAGQLYGRFDRSLQDVNKIRDAGPFSVLDLLTGAGGLELGHFAGVHPYLIPAAVAARPLTRAFLGSRAYQTRAIARPPGGYVPPTISPTLQALRRANRLSPLVAQEAQPQQQ